MLLFLKVERSWCFHFGCWCLAVGTTYLQIVIWSPKERTISKLSGCFKIQCHISIQRRINFEIFWNWHNHWRCRGLSQQFDLFIIFWYNLQLIDFDVNFQVAQNLILVLLAMINDIDFKRCGQLLNLYKKPSQITCKGECVRLFFSFLGGWISVNRKKYFL